MIKVAGVELACAGQAAVGGPGAPAFPQIGRRNPGKEVRDNRYAGQNRGRATRSGLTKT